MKNYLFFNYLKLKKHLSAGISGIGVIEIILILVVLVGLVLIFKSQLTTIMNNVFKSIKTDINTL